MADDLLPTLLQACDSREAAREALRGVTRGLHEIGRLRGPWGVRELHTGPKFAADQIWGQLELHRGAVLPALDRRLSWLETVDVPTPPPPAPGSAAPPPTRVKARAAGLAPAPAPARRTPKAAAPARAPAVAAAEDAGAAPKRRKRKAAAEQDDEPLGRGGRYDEEEEEEGDAASEAGAVFPEGAPADDEDRALMAALDRELAKDKDLRRKAKKERKTEAEEDGEEDAEAEAVLGELYGEGEFDPDDDLALEGQRDEEEGEDEEGEEDGGGVEGLDDGEAGPSEGSLSRKARRDQRLALRMLEDDDMEDGAEDEEAAAAADNALPPEVHDTAEASRPLTQVDKLEAKLLGEKPWAMRGEVNAKHRPVNSLLEDDFVVEHAMKQIPVITEEMTHSLEDRIRRRVQDKIFDDVFPKVALTAKKDVAAPPLDAAKSSLSLVDLYEKDYLEKKRLERGESNVPEPPKLDWHQQEEKEAIEQWFRLARALDALSHSHFAPHPVINPDLAVTKVTGAAAQKEEVAPTVVSQAQLLAPQDTFTPPSNQAGLGLKTAEELTREDRRRLRHAKKHEFRVERKQKERRQTRKVNATKEEKRVVREGKVREALSKGEAAPPPEDEGPVVPHPKVKRVKVFHIHQKKQLEQR